MLIRLSLFLCALRPSRFWKASFAFLFLILISFLSFAAQARSEDKIVTIRDAEIERYLHTLAEPVFNAALIDPASVKIILIQDSQINAFVAQGMNLFIYTGLLQNVDTPEQLLGVIAHETGHIAGGHLVRGREAMENASTEAILGMLFGVAAGVASHNGEAMVATMSGSQQIAQRSFLNFSRTQEASADTAALSFLDRAQITSAGLLEFMQKLGAQDVTPTERQAEYVRTHPLTQDRIDNIQHHLEGSPYKDKKLAPLFQKEHERMKAKLLGYLQPEYALLRYADKDANPTHRYARAIALYRTNKLDRALTIMDGLLKEEPENPFFYELKGQMLFETGRVDEALGPYKKSVELYPSSSLLREGYGHALLEGHDPQDGTRIDLAIQQLTEANRLEPHQPDVWRYLAAAFGKKAEITKNPQDEALVPYALAEEALAKGNDKEARGYAERALKNLKKDGPYALRAQDIKLSVNPDRDH